MSLLSTIKHSHHRIPRHRRHEDPHFDEDNVEELSVSEHAETHMWLWIWFGKYDDFVAWKYLSGLVPHADALRLLTIERNKTRIGPKNHFYGKPSTEKQILTRQKDYIVISPEGEVYEITNLKNFCVEHGLSYSTMRSVASPKKPHKSHRGWKIFRI